MLGYIGIMEKKMEATGISGIAGITWYILWIWLRASGLTLRI